MRLVPFTAHFGAEIHDFDLTRVSDDIAAANLRKLLTEKFVLVFRGQTLTPEAHVRLGHVFGTPAPRHPLYDHVPGHEPIMIIRNDKDHPPENEVWHSDLSCKAHPPAVSILHGVTLPPSGGDTLWCNMHAVHDALSTPMRQFLGGLTAIHDFQTGFAYVRDRKEERVTALDQVEREANRTRHPIIKPHPRTGRPLIYVNESFTSHIHELPEHEGRPILRMLFDMVKNATFQMRLRWEPGTVVMWDNMATQHFAVGDHYPQLREMHRVTVLPAA
jgi:taurine dioxygenase